MGPSLAWPSPLCGDRVPGYEPNGLWVADAVDGDSRSGDDFALLAAPFFIPGEPEKFPGLSLDDAFVVVAAGGDIAVGACAPRRFTALGLSSLSPPPCDGIDPR